MQAIEKDHLQRFGFATPAGSPHVSRTMMLSELSELLEHVDDDHASKGRYVSAIVEENCLGKRTDRNRVISKRYLVELYSLDSNLLLFRALLYLWKRDVQAHPLLALLCAYARDTLLRGSASYILPLSEGDLVTRLRMEHFLDGRDPGRYSPGKLTSNAQNLNSTWTQSGHLVGRSRKIRTKVSPTAGSVSYALLLGYLSGRRGEALFLTEYARLLDSSKEQLMILAEEASRRGWIVFKRVGTVVEVLFPSILTTQELEWIREQD